MTHRLLKNKFQHLQTPDASAEINNELSEDKGHNFAINDVTEALQSDVKKKTLKIQSTDKIPKVI